ncbi:hypothetical protein BDN70DRAFT_898700 [Pholiota conissans]|uniref:NACHT domain-containing protein n=1 Tax=Pholiota conissans TaxID=109636 RepID=A0A9P5YTF4_9AGAR|nr:hypothetical protein BDN70DRAFT_898700 [Pholiota conissans]
MGIFRKRLSRSLTGLASIFSGKHAREGQGGEVGEQVESRRMTDTASIRSFASHHSAPAMFNELHNASIYGGTFIQNNAVKTDRSGFKLLLKYVAASAFHNSAQRIEPSRCHPDTRVAILQQISAWIDQSYSSSAERLLWLNGAAGAGKSAILQTIAERYSFLASLAIASFFFFRADPTRNTISSLIATLVYQLIQSIPETSNDIFLTLEQHPLIFEQSLEVQLCNLIVLPLMRLPAPNRRLFVILIDGLDECNDRVHQASLIKVLGNILSDPTIPILCLISSRLEPQIEMAFEQCPLPDMVQSISLDDIQASDDIRRYLTAKFAEIKSTHPRRSFLAPNWPSPTAVDEIVEKSSGQFIYAAVVIGYISSPHTHPAVQLDIVMGIRPNPASSDSPFAQLDALYCHIFSQVKDIAIVLDILALSLLTHSTDKKGGEIGLRLQRLDALFQFAPGELEVYMGGLTALVRCDRRKRDEAAMKFLHASLIDFLLDERRSREYYINLDVFRTKLLCRFLTMPVAPVYLAPSSSLSLSTVGDSETLSIYVSSRIFAIRTLLRSSKDSEELRSALMQFEFTCYTEDIFRTVHECCIKILMLLRNKNFYDGDQIYPHILCVFSSEFAKYWPSDEENLKRLERQWDAPDLLERVRGIQALDDRNTTRKLNGPHL